MQQNKSAGFGLVIILIVLCIIAVLALRQSSSLISSEDDQEEGSPRSALQSADRIQEISKTRNKSYNQKLDQLESDL